MPAYFKHGRHAVINGSYLTRWELPCTSDYEPYHADSLKNKILNRKNINEYITRKRHSDNADTSTSVAFYLEP